MTDGSGKIAVSAAVLLAFAAVITLSGHVSFGQENHAAKVVFAVHCYDDGAKALQGMPGVIRIEKGFHLFRETDTVYYDPKVITIDKMEKTLKQAGTYRETIR